MAQGVSRALLRHDLVARVGVALRIIQTNRPSRHNAMPGSRIVMMVSRLLEKYRVIRGDGHGKCVPPPGKRGGPSGRAGVCHSRFQVRP